MEVVTFVWFGISDPAIPIIEVLVASDPRVILPFVVVPNGEPPTAVIGAVVDSVIQIAPIIISPFAQAVVAG